MIHNDSGSSLVMDNTIRNSGKTLFLNAKYNSIEKKDRTPVLDLYIMLP